MSAKPKRGAPTPRSSANLAIGFGLVSVPVALRPIAETSSPVAGKLVCPQHGDNKEQVYLCCAGTPQEHLLKRSDMSTAYEHPDKPGELVVVDPGVLKEIAEERSGHIEVEKFVDVETIDPIFYDKTYLCWPQSGGEQAFDLFATVLRDEGKAAVSTVVMSKQTVMLVIRWSETTGTLVAHTCRFHSHVRWADAELVSHYAEQRPEPAEKHLEMARTLIASMVGEFEASEVVDRYTPLLEDAIRAAADGTTFVAPETIPTAAKEDLLDALAASVQAVKKPTPAKKPRAKAKV